MVIVPYSMDMSNNGMFSPRDKFPDVQLQKWTRLEFYAQLSSSPNGKGTLMLPHVRSPLSSVKVVKPRPLEENTTQPLSSLCFSNPCLL
ncbi:hypothetical protein NL676_014154 [Syzygium grande]|nr:hypothetical protein NL676_014154 [Syzygium grande]